MSVFDRLKDEPLVYDDGFDASDLEPVARLTKAFESVPEKCRSCEFLQMLAATALRGVETYAEARYDVWQRLDTSPEEELQIARDALAAVNDLEARLSIRGIEIPVKLDNMSPEEARNRIRELNGFMLDNLYELSLATVNDFADFMAKCGNGPLKMRAAKDGKGYLVTLCTSDALTNDHPSEYPTIVKVKWQEK